MMRSIPYIPVPYYTEGPAIDGSGNIYCTTLSGSSILKFDQNGNYSVWGKSACPNGQIILPDGQHLVCDSKDSGILRFSEAGILLRDELEKKFTSEIIYVPNDLIVDEWGGIYFTDSIRYEGKIGYLDPDGTANIVARNLDYPNGLVISEDKKQLFVAESYRNRIMVLPLRSPGIAGGKLECFAELPFHGSGNALQNLPDGIRFDPEGNLYVAHYGMQKIRVLNKNGKLIRSIETPFPLVSNVFINYNTLIATGGFGEPGPGGLFITTI